MIDTVKPTFDVPLEHKVKWKDPTTGVWVPKRLGANLEWREKLLRKADEDEGLQRDLLAACKESALFYVNAFCYTYHQFDIDPVTHQARPSDMVDHPFITWPVQDELFKEFNYAFNNGKDLLIDKSRDMGASWCCLVYLDWLWLFRSGTEIRLMSRQEGLVDGNTADSLFWKLDYLHKWYPLWMRPPGVLIAGKDNRTKLRIYNPLMDSTHVGEATTSVSLSGGRAAVLFLDEFAKVQNGDKIRSATRDVAPCRIINSTPFGAGTEYSTWKTSGQVKVFRMMYWNHPQKGQGRYVTKDELGRYTIRSPWFDAEEKVRKPSEIAQEILAKDVESGQTMFNISNVDRHIALYGKEPSCYMNVKLKDCISNSGVKDHIKKRAMTAIDVRQARGGKLLVWSNLVLGRPVQDKHYIFGIDTSKGQGASESVVSIKCKETGEKIARWSDANTPPYEFARVVVALAIWCGGALPSGLPFLKWEENGPGWDLGRLLVKIFMYPYYYVNERPGIVGSGRPDTNLKYGWHASDQSKNELLALYDRVLVQGGYVNHDKKGLEQCKLYIHYPGGGCGPAYLQYENKAARKLHGDITIADALTIEDDRIPVKKVDMPLLSLKTFQGRYDRFKKSKNKPKGWRRPFAFVEA